MIISAKTDIGLRRDANQDCFAYGQPDSGTLSWAVVCDGMGGMAAGNIASELAVTVISRAFEDNLSASSSPGFITGLMKTAVEAANAAVFDAAGRQPECHGMGTTAVAAVVTETKAFFAHAGDSRAYLLREGRLTQITTDHSIVQSMVESGQLTADEAEHHPNRNIITRAVGVNSDIEVDLSETEIGEGDIVLLCTDGLTNCVDVEQIFETLVNTEFSVVAERLIALANRNGGTDNITVAAIRR